MICNVIGKQHPFNRVLTHNIALYLQAFPIPHRPLSIDVTLALIVSYEKEEGKEHDRFQAWKTAVSVQTRRKGSLSATSFVCSSTAVVCVIEFSDGRGGQLVEPPTKGISITRRPTFHATNSTTLFATTQLTSVREFNSGLSAARKLTAHAPRRAS